MRTSILNRPRPWLSPIAAAVILILSPNAHAQQAALRFGPLAFGATVEEARAALPEARWHSLATLPSGAVSTATAADAVDFAGRRAHVWVRHTRYERGLVLDTEIDALTALQCVEQSRTWYLAARDATGPLQAKPPHVVTQPGRTTFNATRTEGGLVVLPQTTAGSSTTFGETIALAPDATAMLDARRGVTPWPQSKWRRRDPDTFTLNASNGQTTLGNPHVEVTTEFDPRRCRLRLEVSMALPKPPPAAFAYDAAKATRRPSLALRHHTMLAVQTPDPVGAPLAAPLTRTMQCSLDRTTGLTFSCRPPAETPPLANAHVRALRQLAMGYIFDMTGVDVDDPQEMTISLPVTLDPGDVRSYAFADQPANATGRVRFARRPEILRMDYPPAALHENIEADLTVTCQAQADQSVICTHARAAAPAHAALFRAAAINATRGVRVEPTLTDGATSNGAVFDVRLQFRIE